MSAALLVLLGIIQVVVAWSLRSGWVSFDGYALLRRAAEQPWGDPFHLAVPTIFATAHELLGPHGFSAIESATLVSCLASGVTVAATAAWCLSLGATRPLALLGGLMAAWTPATAHAALGVEVNSLHMASCACAMVAAARYHAIPSVRALVLVFLSMLVAVLMHVGSLAFIPGWTWFALRSAPQAHRRAAAVAGLVSVVALVAFALRPFKSLTDDPIAAPSTLSIADWVWTTIRRPRESGGIPHSAWEWIRNFYGLIGVPAVLATVVVVMKPRAFRPIVWMVLLPVVAFVATGTSWLGFTLPLVSILIGVVVAELTTRRFGAVTMIAAFVVTFGWSAEVGPGGAGYRLRHFSFDPLTATADALVVMLPKNASLIAGNSCGPLRYRGVPGREAVAEVVMEGGARGLKPLEAIEARVAHLRSIGSEVWIAKDALDYLQDCGVEQVAVLARIDSSSIRRAGPDEARIARWR